MSDHKKSWLALFLFAIALTFVVFLTQAIIPAIVHQGAYYIIAFFLLLTIFTHYISLLGFKHIPDKFALVYLGTMTFRLLMGIGLIIIVLLQGIPDRILFVANFAFVYLAFLIFEIYALLTTLRSNSQKRAENAEKKQEKSA